MICGLQIGHTPSIAVSQNGKLIYYNEERKLSQKKREFGIPFRCIDQLNFKIDKFVSTNYNFDKEEIYQLTNYLRYKKLLSENDDVFCFYKPHHLSHAIKAFIDSGFESARVFVIDGRGSDWDFERTGTAYETCSIYEIKLGKIICIYKRLFNKNISTSFKLKSNLENLLVSKDTIFDIKNTSDLGHFYQSVSKHFGYVDEEGKFMGLQSYGKPTNIDVSKINILEKTLDVAATCQKKFEDDYSELVQKYESSNMIFTGGTALNVVNNYKIFKKFKKSNLYFEPLCEDVGNSIGAVYSWCLKNNIKIEKLKDIYLGTHLKVDKKILENEIIIDDVDINKIVDILKDGNVVGLIQGKAEAGPRALGNRSLLLDPTLSNCKQVMNQIKKREKFRPFAISIKENFVEDYFYDIKFSPYMMYAAQAKPKAKKNISGVIHVDNTCRVQTVNENNNFFLYNLLDKFKVPILMNTSFNLAGYPIVESFEDVLFSMRNSIIKYVYFADEKKLLVKNESNEKT